MLLQNGMYLLGSIGSIALALILVILEAEGEALAIQLVNEAAEKYFVGNAQLLRRLITVERALDEHQDHRPVE